MTGSDQETLTDLPPSAKLIYKVLKQNNELTQKEIVEKSMLSARTARYALDRLESINVIEQDVYYRDARQNLYRVVDPKAQSCN